MNADEKGFLSSKLSADPTKIGHIFLENQVHTLKILGNYQKMMKIKVLLLDQYFQKKQKFRKIQ